MNVREAIWNAIAGALEGLGIANTGGAVGVEHTADLSHGDYSSNAALACAKEAGLHPHELAEKIVAKLGAIEGVSKIKIERPGFINFHLAPSALATSVEAAIKEDRWGANKDLVGKKIMVEYTDPNPFKEFHIGHLVPNALGESLSRLLQFSGAEVKRANWQGDVGVHVAKALFILLEKNITDPKLGDLAAAYVEGSKRYDEDADAKTAIDALNKKIYEKSDPKVNALYEKGRKLSLEHFEEIYKTLGTTFDFYFFESEGGPKGIEVVRSHPEIFPQSDGAIVFRGEEYGLHTRVFINSAGLPTYEAKEIGLALMKKETWPFDLTITITGNEQADYFRVVIKAMELALPELKGRLTFKTNGMLRFAEGKMSSRAGNIVRGEDLINDLAEVARARAKESRADDPEELARQIAVAATKYQILKQGFGKNIIFDRERALSLEGDSGPYLQYAHARAHQILERANASGVRARFDASAASSDLARLLHRFPEIVERAAAEYEPHLVTNYLLQVASEFNRWYAQEQILDGTPAAAHKVALTAAVARTLKNGLWILGIPAPEKM